MTRPDDNLPVSHAPSRRCGASAAGPLPVIVAGVSGDFSPPTSATGNTRKAYFAAAQFSAWCEQRKLRIEDIEPIHVAGYIEQLHAAGAKPTVNQHLAAIRMLFDCLVTGR